MEVEASKEDQKTVRELLRVQMKNALVSHGTAQMWYYHINYIHYINYIQSYYFGQGGNPPIMMTTWNLLTFHMQTSPSSSPKSTWFGW